MHDVTEVIGGGSQTRFTDYEHAVEGRKRIEVRAPICCGGPPLIRIRVPDGKAVRTQARMIARGERGTWVVSLISASRGSHVDAATVGVGRQRGRS